MMFFKGSLIAVNLPLLKLELELPFSALLSFTVLTSNVAGTEDWVALVWAIADAGAGC
jgi:hypothetical protein